MTRGLQRQLAELRRQWDDMASEDPFWVVLATDRGKHGGWEAEDFFRTGESEISGVIDHAECLGRPVRRERALDFGCGLGRATRAIGSRFRQVVGVDISEAMIVRARELNADQRACNFVLNRRADLSSFADGAFDLVYAGRVLQHQSSREAIDRYLSELVRVLDPEGLLVFQLPRTLPLALRLQPRRKLFLGLHRLGLSTRTLYWRLGLHPLRMHSLPEERVRRIVAREGARVLKLVVRRDPDYGFQDGLYFVGKG
jgi:SAM-dependent methyltransferase